MNLGFGIAVSEDPDSHAAGVTLARAAAARCSAAPRLALCFATARHDFAALSLGVRKTLGPGVRLAGGSSLGVITQTSVGYEGFQSGLLLLGGPDLQVDHFVARDVQRHPEAAGAELARQLTGQPHAGTPNLLLFHTAVPRAFAPADTLFTPLRPLLSGLGDIQTTWPHAAGLNLRGDWDFSQPDHLLFDQEVLNDAAAAVCLSGGGLRMDTLVLHGCQPLGGYHTITAASGSIVERIDDQPAIAFVCHKLGVPESLLLDGMASFTLGLHQAPRYTAFREEDYINRVSTRAIPGRGLEFLEPDLQTGTQVQVMRRHINMEDITARVRRFCAGLTGHPLCALYLDCGGRTAPFSGTETEEANAVLRGLHDLPVFGGYGGGEIGRIGGRLQPLSWTGVLCVLTVQP